MAGYVNPIPPGVTDTRVDQGVDFQGSGNILALGDAQIIETGGAGWPGGPFMSYRLLDGPDAGKVVYVAENIRPSVTAGQRVTAGAVIAQMFNGGTGIETGWADSSGTRPESQLPEAGGISGANLPPGGTLIGRDFENLLRSLGTGPASNLGATPGGTLPPGWSNPASGPAAPASVSSPSGGGTTCLGLNLPVLGCVGTQVPSLGSIEHTAFQYLERAGLFILGGLFIVFGVWLLFKDKTGGGGSSQSASTTVTRSEEPAEKEIEESVR